MGCMKLNASDSRITGSYRRGLASGRAKCQNTMIRQVLVQVEEQAFTMVESG
jgi:hypothetical protein